MTYNISGNLFVKGNVSIGGTTTLSADPTSNLQAATKQYVDNHSSPSSGTIKTTSPLYAITGGTITINGATVLTAYEQIADQTFNCDYNTRGNYTEENNTTGTDWANGSFTLHGTGNPDSNTKLLCHFDSGLVDDSHNSVVITNNGGVSLSPKFGNSSCYFDGISSYLQGPSGNAAFQFSADFTVECWVYLCNSQTGVIFSNLSGVNNSSGFAIYIASNNIFKFYTAGQPSVTHQTTLNLNIWTHIAAVRLNNIITLYINGTVSSSTSNNSTNFSDSRCDIGWDVSINYIGKLNGFIDEFRISQSVINQGGARYTTNFTPSTSAFTNDGKTSLLLHFDGNINDSSNNNLNLINSNATLKGPCQFGQASGYFSGNYLTIPASAFNPGSSNFVVEAWIFPTNVSTWVTIFAINNTNFVFQIYNSQIYGYAVGTQSATMSITANTWHHVAFVRSGNSIYIYVDGVRSSLTSVSGNCANDTWGIGAYNNGGYPFYGYIDELRLSVGTDRDYNTPTIYVPTVRFEDSFSNTNLLCHFDKQPNQDDSLKQLTMSTGIVKIGTSSAYFGGGGCTVTGPTGSNFQFPGNFTIECWVYPISLSGGDGGSIFESTNSWASATGINLIATNGNIALVYNGAWPVSSGGVPFSLNTWSHVAVVRSGSTINLYINGTSVGSNTYSTSFSDGYCKIGSGTHGSFNGYIDEFRISNSVARYTGNFTPSTNPFYVDNNTTLLLHFDGNVIDSSYNALTMTNTSVTFPNNAPTEYMPINPKFGTYSAYFDGSSSSLTASSNAAFRFSGDFTIECWIYPMGFASYQSIFSNQTGNGTAGFYFGLTNGTPFLSQYGVGSPVTGAVVVALNQWQHLAVTRLSGILSLWLNGVYIGSGSSSTNWSDGQCYIGSNFSNYRYNGFMDELRINNTTAVYTTNFTPPSSAFTAITGTSLLLHFEGGSLTVSDSSSNNIPITNNAVGGLTSLYKFGTNSCWFNGVDAYLTGPSGNNAFKFAADFTVECWVYPTVLSWQCIFTSQIYHEAGGIDLYIGASGQLRVGRNWLDNYDSSTTLININNWSHLALVRSGTTTSIYLNGTSVVSTTAYNGVNFSSGYCSIGTDYNNGSLMNFFKGYIDEFRISNNYARYTSNFTPASSPFSADANTSLLLHFDGNYTDSNTYNGGPLTITNTNTSQSTGPKFGVGCAYFNGTSNYISIPQNEIPDFGTKNFVIEAWVFQSGQVSGYNAAIFSTYSNANFTTQLYIDGNILKFYYRIDGTGIIISGGTVPINIWTHIAVSRSGSTIRLFINGILQNSGTETNPLLAYYTEWTIGRSGLVTGFYKGYIDELRISLNTDRGYTNNFTPAVTQFTDVVNTYVNGPYYVSTTANSQINLTPYDTIATATVSATEPNTTTLRFLCSFDNKSTWKTYSGGSWSTVTMTSANIISSGMSISQLQNALPNWSNSLGTTLDIVAAFQTSNTSASPTLDNIQITAADYHLINPVVDYSVVKGSGGSGRTLTFTRLKPGNANHEIDYM